MVVIGEAAVFGDIYVSHQSSQHNDQSDSKIFSRDPEVSGDS